jgi:antitoxin VapB
VALSIRDPETDRLARELAGLTGETMTQAIRRALEQRLQRERRVRRAREERLAEELNAIGRHCASLPELDPRSPEELLYDERGLPA